MLFCLGLAAALLAAVRRETLVSVVFFTFFADRLVAVVRDLVGAALDLLGDAFEPLRLVLRVVVFFLDLILDLAIWNLIVAIGGVGFNTNDI